MPNNPNQNNSNFVDENNIPENWQPITAQPINPNIPMGGPPAPILNQYTSGPLPPNFNAKSPALNTTGYPASTGPIALMDIQGGPQVNAKSESVVTTVIERGGTNVEGSVISLETNGTSNSDQTVLNLQSGANVVLTAGSGGNVNIATGAHEVLVNTIVAPGSEVNFNGTTPAPISGTTNVVFQSDGGSPETNVSAYMPLMVGDTGSGGTSGAVPAPPTGSAAAGKFLKADGTFEVPSASTPFYQTVQQAGVSKSQEAKLNFLGPITAVDNSGNGSTDITVPVMVGDTGSGGVEGLVPAPPSGSGATDYLRADGSWDSPPGTGGVTVVAIDLTGQNTNISATTIATPGANGYYRISGWDVSTNTPTGGVIPAVSIKFTDPDSNVAQTVVLLQTATANAAGVFASITTPGAGTPTWSGTFYAKSGVAIQYETTGYTAGSGTALVYALHLRLEGPF